MKKKRLALLRVSSQLIVDLRFFGGRKVKGGVEVATMEGLPENTVVSAVYYDSANACFLFHLEHDSFSEVEQGQRIPELNVKVHSEFIPTSAPSKRGREWL